MLLVARAAGEWWRMLVEDKDVRDTLADSRRCLLGPVKDKAVMAAALSSFATRLGIEPDPREAGLTCQTHQRCYAGGW